jgi:lysozyme
MADVKRAATVGGAIVAALGLAVPLVQHWEGLRTTPYRDVTGLSTVCYGDTKDVRARTPDECSVLLVARMAHDYAPAVIKCVPGLADRPHQLAASISLSYNIGSNAFCRSTAAKRFNAGQWAAGCDAFLLFRYAGGRPSQGLLNRRKSERELCRSDL